jgi:HEAT repeat protein
VRIASVSALGQLNCKEAIPELTRVSATISKRSLRIITYAVLACLGEKVEVDESGLTELVSMRNFGQNQAQICDLLARLKIKRAIPVIKQQFLNNTVEFYRAAKAALKQLEEE